PFFNIPDEKTLNLGMSICNSLRSGMSTSTIARSLVGAIEESDSSFRPKFSEYFATVTIEAASVLCPEQWEKI
ncbi:MAG TPA: DUF732 domain-containing protein, partial [Coleofasciculaceae cyanobacterium]